MNAESKSSHIYLPQQTRTIDGRDFLVAPYPYAKRNERLPIIGKRIAERDASVLWERGWNNAIFLMQEKGITEIAHTENNDSRFENSFLFLKGTQRDFEVRINTFLYKGGIKRVSLSIDATGPDGGSMNYEYRPPYTPNAWHFSQVYERHKTHHLPNLDARGLLSEFLESKPDFYKNSEKKVELTRRASKDPKLEIVKPSLEYIPRNIKFPLKTL